MIALTVIPRTSALAQDVTGRWKGRIEPTNHSAEIELELQRQGGVACEMPCQISLAT